MENIKRPSELPNQKVCQGDLNAQPSKGPNRTQWFQYKAKMFIEEHPHAYMVIGGFVFAFLAIVLYYSLGYTEKAASEGVNALVEKSRQEIAETPPDMVLKTFDRLLDDAKALLSSSDFGYYKFWDKGARSFYTNCSLFSNITK